MYKNLALPNQSPSFHLPPSASLLGYISSISLLSLTSNPSLYILSVPSSSQLINLSISYFLSLSFSLYLIIPLFISSLFPYSPISNPSHPHPLNPSPLIPPHPHGSTPFYKIIVPTVDTIRYNYIVTSLVNSHYPVMLVGPVGTGKTSVAHSVLDELDPRKYSSLTVNMSAQVCMYSNKQTICVVKFNLN